MKLEKKEDWWDVNYHYKKRITLKNASSDSLASGIPVQVTIDTKTLYDDGKLQNDCDDLRIVYSNDDINHTELTRSYYTASGATNCSNSQATVVTFPLQADIASGGIDDDYFVYYGNGEASSPGSGDNGYDIGDAHATLVCPFNGTTTCLDGETPTTASGAIRYSGAKSALSFDGKDDKVTVNTANLNYLGEEKLTVEFWFKGFLGGTGSIFNINNYSGLFDFNFQQNQATGTIRVGLKNTIEQYTQWSLTNCADGNWHHIAVTYDAVGGSDNFKLWVDGVNERSITVTQGLRNQLNGVTSIGCYQNFMNFNSSTLDEVRFSNTLRYTSNFTPQTTPFEPDEHTVLLFHFDENGDDPRNTGKAIDSSGNGNHGTITGAKYVSGLVGVDNTAADTGKIPLQSYASHQGIFIEEGTTNLVTNPSFEHGTYNTNWGLNYFNFDINSSTFTPNMAKRNSAGPFAAGVMVGGKWVDGSESDILTFERGSQISGNFFSNKDMNQGSIVLWITPEWNGNDDVIHYIYGTSYFSLVKTAASSLYVNFYDGNSWVSSAVKNVSDWVSGSTYLVIFRWDMKNKLDGTNHTSITVNNLTIFGTTSVSGIYPPWNTYRIYSNNALIEGLTVYRRPLFDGQYGIDVGNGNEIEQIYNNGAGKDPTLVTGSWDVVFDLPTNASTGALSSGTGNAWTHPHASNVLYTSTTNTGGFMMNGTYTNDGWTDYNSPVSVSALATNEKIYAGGYKWTNDETNDGIKYSKSGLTAGQNYVVRALAHSDGTSIPKIQIWDATNNAEITQMTGSTSCSSRTSPCVFIFTFELPTVARNGVPSNCLAIEVRILNTQVSGTVYWHQVELQQNLVDNPSMEATYSGTPQLPPGWSQMNMQSGWTEEELVNVHSGSKSVQFNSENSSVWFYQDPGGSVATGKFYSQGAWTYGDNNRGFAMGSWNGGAQPQYTLSYWSNRINTPITATWSHTKAVFRQIGNRANVVGSTGTSTGERFVDDSYLFLLNDVSLSVTPASLANSTETTGVRVDGADKLSMPVSGISSTRGIIRFRYTPCHSAADVLKFGEYLSVPHIIMLTNGSYASGRHTETGGNSFLKDPARSWTTNQWVGHRVYNRTDNSSGIITANTANTVTATLTGGVENDWDDGDKYEIMTDSFIRLYWSSANILTLAFNDTGGVHSSTWDATGIITAGTTYVMEINYTGSGMSLKVNDVVRTTISTDINFSTLPTDAYFGSAADGTQASDCTISNFTALTPTENTTAPYYKFGSKSAKLVNGGTTGDDYTTYIDPNSTATHTLSAYVYDGTTGNIGGIVDATVAKLVFGSAVVTPASYTDMGGGWWRLAYSAPVVDESLLYGVHVLAGKTIYVDGVQLEAKSYATTYADGSLGNGYSWSGSENESASVRLRSNLSYPTSTNINENTGTISFWVKSPSATRTSWGNIGAKVFMYADNSNLFIGKNNPYIYVFLGKYNFLGGDTSSYSQDKWYLFTLTWRANNDAVNDFARFYVNSVQTGSRTGVALDVDMPSTLYFGSIGSGDAFIVYSDLRVFDRALNVSEIADLYYQGLAYHSPSSEEVDRYKPEGYYITPTLNLGNVADWSIGDDFVATYLLNGGFLSFKTSTSKDGIEWTDFESLNGSEIVSTPQRYVKVRADFSSNPDQSETPNLSGLRINYIPDNTPPLNPSYLSISPGDPSGWYNDTTPTFAWPRSSEEGGAIDPGEGASGVKGYHVYLGPDPSAIPYTTETNKEFILEPEDGDVVFTPSIPLPSTGVYYLRIQAEDNAGNYPGNNPEDVWEAFTYQLDLITPEKPLYISVNPSGYTKENKFTFTWPAGSDGDSGVWGYCYKAGDGEETCEPKEALVDGDKYKKYLEDVAYQAGENVFYVRTKDNGGNFSSYAQVTFYWNPNAPSAPINVTAEQVAGCGGSANCWKFTWDKPLEYTESIVRYYYSVNEKPTKDSPTTTSEETELFSAGTRQGQNTFYVVAEDVVDVNFGVYGEVNFNVNTVAPGIPPSVSITDSSNRDKNDWALTTKWIEPTDKGSGIDHYNVYRSEDGDNYIKIATTKATGYLDTNLSDSKTYYYKVSAEDNAGAESGLSASVSRKPTGKYSSSPRFGGVPVAETTAHTAVIQWTTDRPSDSYVEYGYTKNYELGRVGSNAMVISHKVILTGLKAETEFHFRTQSLDDGAFREYGSDEGYSEDYTFSTKKAPDITEVSISEITLNSALISWKTTTIATSEVRYGKTINYDNLIKEQSSSLTTIHSIRLTGLSNGTLYHFKIIGIDLDGAEISSDDYIFQTLPYPNITEIKVEAMEVEGESGVNVTWKSNVPATSIVKYFPKNSENEVKEMFKSDLVTEHEMFISGLLDATTYYLIVSERDVYGNLAVRETQSFTTAYDTKPPEILKLTIDTASQGVGKGAKSQLIVSWETNEPSTSQVEYGLGVSNKEYSNKTNEDTNLVKNHIVIVNDLEPSMPYHLRVVSKDAAGNTAYSVDNVVVTRMPSESAFDLIINALKENFGWIFLR